MSSEINKASQEAVDAARNSDQLALIQAVLAAQQVAAQQAPACQHQAPVAASGGAGKWLAIGIRGGFLAVSLAVSMVAVAISAVALTCCLIVLRSMWRDSRKGK